MEQTLDTFISITKALGDPHRVRAFMALRGGELCVCQIIEMLELAPSTVSKHMSILKQAGLVKSRKEERWIYYRLPDKEEQSDEVRGGLVWIFQALKNSDTICRDNKDLIKITKQNPSNLCKMQRGK